MPLAEKHSRKSWNATFEIQERGEVVICLAIDDRLSSGYYVLR